MQSIKLIAIISLPLLISCNMVSFEKPMPLDGKTLPVFSKSLIGNYYMVDSMFDSTIYNEKYYPDIYKTRDSVKTGFVHISISENVVKYAEVEKSYYDTTKLDMSKITLELTSNNKKTVVARKTIDRFILVERTETGQAVNLSGKDVLKEKDGIFYINIKNEENDWTTFQLTKGKKGMLTVNTLSGDDLEDLPANFNVENKSFNTYLHDITPEKFDYIVKHKYFTKFFVIRKQ